MPATRGELAFPVLDREQRGHHGLAFVVGRTEEILRIGDFLVDAVLRSAVPIDGKCACFLDHRPERKADAGRNDALHAVDFFLLHELAEALDRVLGRGLVLDHQFDLAAADAALARYIFRPPIAWRGCRCRPGAAAMPERGARMPMRSGLFCAIAGAKMPAEAETAQSAAADARSLRREIAMEVLPVVTRCCGGSYR